MSSLRQLLVAVPLLALAFVCVFGLAYFMDKNEPDIDTPPQEAQQVMSPEELADYEAEQAAYYEEVERQKAQAEERTDAEDELLKARSELLKARLESSKEY